MEDTLSTQERQLCQLLADLPARFNYRYTPDAPRELLHGLFWFLAGGKDEYMRLLFKNGKPSDALKLADAQGAVGGAEYTEAARGKRCGHIFKPGEASYMCRTCGTDETCCLCSRCFDSTDHTGHMVRISISVGNSGCCDCGDDEAWKAPLFCTVHSDNHRHRHSHDGKGKHKVAPSLPEDLVNSIRMTTGRVLDYICDVISCSPEQLRENKTKESILKDEETSRLSSAYYGQDAGPCTRFDLVLWNDEKHTVNEVQDQVARACRKSPDAASKNAWETDTIGRSLLVTLPDVDRLIQMAKTMESIRVTVTIRSSRDTFREQMCGTLVEWLSDISGCSVGHDNRILRQTVCEELMKPWRQGSSATHTSGLIDDEEEDDQSLEARSRLRNVNERFILALQAANGNLGFGSDDDDDDDDDDADADNDDGDADMDEPDDGNDSGSASGEGDDDILMVDARGEGPPDVGMSWVVSESLEEDEATMAGYPPPPPPPPAAPPTTSRPANRDRDGTPSDSDAAEPLIAQSVYAKANLTIPKTPGKTETMVPRPGRYWIETPTVYTQRQNVPLSEDVFQRVRLDWLLLFDLRMWKKVRNDLRALYISTVVQVPEFKRVLALRFASLYTVLAQLYLVGDREPDHSIINLSLQMLTTPSITAEVVERGNFLSSLFAILYTFLTTRQVGHPWDVSPDAVLAFDSGSVTNRRMYHFYQDLKYLFGSEHVQERLRSEPRYLMQFLDLVKLHQCIGPNVRAVIEHVEYEADSWITASLVTRQINLQARNLAEAFRDCAPDEIYHLQRAIRTTAKAVIINSIGAERHRFKTGEIKEEVRFKTLSDFEFDAQGSHYDVVKFIVEKDAISFHHALHYTLSWLIECGRSLPASVVRNLLSFTAQELKAKPSLMGRLQLPKKHYDAQDFLIAAFDYPLRVCAWLAQIKANMWVRNGISLRHQASTYRGVGQRDVSHHRDIFLLQVALVVCDPSRMLASIIDRFGMDGWVKGLFEMKSEAQDDSQHLDVVEDMIHLLIVLLTDRTSLLAPEDGESSRILAMRRDITHVLCFKPLSFNEICLKLPEKYQEQEDFHRVLNEMATFKPPEGVSDVGTFELRQEFIEDIDPYIAHYNRNQREESELAYRKKMAKKTGQTPQSIVFEPKPRPIPSGLFQNLADVTGTGVFAQVIYYSLLYTLVANRWTPSVPSTRLETFIQVLLHLILIAIQEDQTTEDHDLDQNQNQNQNQNSFVYTALTKHARSNFMSEASNCTTIVSLLHLMSLKFKAAHPKIAVVMKRLKQKRPEAFDAALARIGVSPDRFSTASPSNASVEEERERKKKAALSRQARVMAQFQEQQKTFLENQGAIDWGSDLGDDDDDRKTEHPEDRKHNWKFPSGTCILCQEEADDRRLYGTFALLIESRVLRQTDFQDADFVREASQTPCNLDRSADEIRPFGVAGENRKMVEKFNAEGELLLAERQTIGKGFKAHLSRPGPVAKSCGHIMHYRCFEQYCEAINRRHNHQIARHHPENTRRNEFVCPLCKALGNAFLPIVWLGFEEAYPGNLQPKAEFEEFMERQMGQAYWFRGSKAREGDEPSIPSMFSPSLRGSLIEAMMTRSSDFNLGDLRGADGADVRSLILGTAGGASTTPPTPEVITEAPAPTPTVAPTVAPPPAESSWNQPFLNELLAALRRLKHTLVVNKLTSADGVLGDELHSSDVLVQAAAFSVSAAEIQQRGVEAQPGMTLLEKIPEQSLAFLRVLSETVYTYITMGTKYPSAGTRIEGEFLGQVERQHHQLFMARYYEAESSGSRQPLIDYPALLSSDPFVFLVECTFGVVAVRNLEIMHVVRLCYLAELVKVVFHMGESMPAGLWLATLAKPQTQDPAMVNFARFALAVAKQRHESNLVYSAQESSHAAGENGGFHQPGVDTLEGWYTFVKKYALVFLRKCVVWLHVNRGVDFNSHFSSNPDADELDRLTEALRLPTFDEMCAAMTDDAATCGWPSTTQAVVRGWVKHQVIWSASHQGQPQGSAMVSHPGIFELLGLPNTYDTLIEEATRRKCPTTGNDLSDPVICLFCGELFCSQSACCLRQETPDFSHPPVGGAQQHMKRCQKNTGIFLNIRKCAIIYLFHKSGSYTAVPYIDRYGETDHLLRHGRQLFLNQKRYDSMIRNLVLSHGIPSLISRKLEAEINNGGWDTL